MADEEVPTGVTPEQERLAGAEPPADVRERHAALSLQIEENRYRYFVLDAPTLSDGQYDRLMREINRLEADYPALRTPDSPTQKVGSTYSTLFTPVAHAERVLSLDNCFSPEELSAWAARVARDSSTTDFHYLC